MPKKAADTRLPSRPTRGNGRSKNQADMNDLFEELETDGDGEAELNTEPATEHRKRQAQKSSAGSSAFQRRKITIYTAARKKSREILLAGTTYIEDAREKFRALKAQEISYEKPFKDMERLCAFQQTSINSLFSAYPVLLDDLAARRSDQVNAASEMLQNNPARRQAALKKFSKNARLHFEEIKENEKVASDASALIKQYKNLLYT